jgi:hypothetical protein
VRLDRTGRPSAVTAIRITNASLRSPSVRRGLAAPAADRRSSICSASSRRVSPVPAPNLLRISTTSDRASQVKTPASCSRASLAGPIPLSSRKLDRLSLIGFYCGFSAWMIGPSLNPIRS